MIRKVVRKRILIFITLFSLLVSFALVSNPSMGAEESDYAWVLVDTYKYPISEYFKPGDPWSYYANFEGNTIELRTTIPYGAGVYGSKDFDNPGDLHAKYTWSNPPSIIKPNEQVTITMNQEVISKKYGNYSIAFSPFFKADVDELKLGYGTASNIKSVATYSDGTKASRFGVGYNRDEQSQASFSSTMSLEFYGKGTEGKKYALYIGAYAGSPGSVGIRYTYEWKKINSSDNNNSNNNSEAFNSGARLSWKTSSGLGYRLYRSISSSSLGISVTDFYITSTSYADVNVEPNTTYYYTVKPVLAEANPYQGISEVMGDTIATFVVTTGNTISNTGSFKNFIMLKLENPYLTKNGISEEIDPGRGTTPIIISGRTMVPIRAIVEAMGGTVSWDGKTQKITLTARGNTVEMWLGSKEMRINGNSVKIDVPPTSKNGRTFVPVRFAAENLNCKVDWINSTKEAVIIYEE